MFILIKAEHGILCGDNEVNAYDTLDEAFDAMCNQVDDERTKYDSDDYDGVSCKERPSYDGIDMTEYGIEIYHAFVEPCDGTEWQIFEV